MSDQKIVDTPENWDAASQGYGSKIAPLLMDDFVEDFLDLLDPSPNHEALEVACGSGILTQSLNKRVKSLLTTDFSPKMIELCKKNNIDSKNTSYQVMDGQALDLPENTFDRTACMFGIMLFPDRDKGFKEQFRVLKPGGKSFFSAWTGPDQFQIFGLLLNGLSKAFPDMPKPATPPPVFSLADLDKFKSEMESAGYKDVTTQLVTKDFSIDGFDNFWEMTTSGAPPIKMFLDKVGPEGEDHLKKTLSEMITEKFGTGPIQLSNTATVGIGFK